MAPPGRSGAQRETDASRVHFEEAAVDVDSVTKLYQTKTGQVKAVGDVSFGVRKGEFVSLVGPSGCGKSTILKMVAGLIPWDKGSIMVAGSSAAAGRREIGIMLQSPVLFPWRTVVENVLLPMELFGRDSRIGRARAQEILSLVGLTGFEEKYPRELSGGMQQRVSLSRLLVYEPSILLMDEPFGALDEFTRERLNLEIASIHERLHRSVLFVTHNVSEAVFLSDRVVVMSPMPGRVADIVDVELSRPRSADLLDSASFFEVVTKVRAVLGLGRDTDRP